MGDGAAGPELAVGQAPDPRGTFAAEMVAAGLDVGDVALEAGVSRVTAWEWSRGKSYPSERYAEDVGRMFGAAGMRRIYEARAEDKEAARTARRERRALALAASLLRKRGRADLARWVAKEASAT